MSKPGLIKDVLLVWMGFKLNLISIVIKLGPQCNALCYCASVRLGGICGVQPCKAEKS